MTGKAAIIGGGVIGGGWAARFLLNGWDVAVHDPHPANADNIAAIVDNARAALSRLSDLPLPAEGRLTNAASIADAVMGSAYIQESVPERLDIKHRVIAAIQEHAPETPLGSSTSGFRPSQLQQGARSPGMIFVAHPFNPVYLLPLVEIVGGPGADPACIARASGVIESLGMFPLHLRREIDAHIADRLLESVWREALWLVRDGVATTAEIDDAIRMGFGLRWAQMGLFETYRIAGGEAGMRHFLAQFGPCLAWPWSRLTDVPPLDDALVEQIAGQSDAQSGHLGIRELERIRDANLVGILRVLRRRDWGAGQVLNRHEAKRSASAPAGALTFPALTVGHGWIGRTGQMTDAGWHAAVAQVVDALMTQLGARADTACGAAGYCIETVHTLRRGAASIGARLLPRVQVMKAGAARVDLVIHFRTEADTVETGIAVTLAHVDLATGVELPAPPEVQGRLASLARAQPGLPRPGAVQAGVTPI